MRRLLLGACAAAVLAGASPAAGARYAVGVERASDLDRVAARLAARGPVSREFAALSALVLEAKHARGLAHIPGVAYVERIDRRRRLAFTPNDPLAPRQWYLAHDRAFDFWPELPALPGVRVAVIDSGIDGGHPEFAGRIALARSFVGGSPLVDEHGHGTFVAGIIAAAVNNEQGIAGIAFPAQLLVAKVVHDDRTVSLEGEIRAIRWAADYGARVINLSLGGLRDPGDRDRDTYSPFEESAIRYAYGKGAVLVASVGNGDQAPRAPWPYASYPAALAHVVGVSAVSRDGNIPNFSNRDAIYNDIAAPGTEIVSTLPRPLTAARPSCAEQGYSICGPEEYRRVEGTSFAAPQVAAAAALMLSVKPSLRPEQAMTVLERAADDLHAGNGCRRCPLQRDALSGWGRLNIAKALAALDGPLPPPDRYETNDDAGSAAATLGGRRRTITATVDFWDDQIDVYRLRLRKGQRIVATLRGPKRTDTNLLLWKPGTKRVEVLSLQLLRMRATQSARPGAVERIAYRSPVTGWYYLEVKLATPGAGAYTLAVTKT